MPEVVNPIWSASGLYIPVSQLVPSDQANTGLLAVPFINLNCVLLVRPIVSWKKYILSVPSLETLIALLPLE